VIVLQVPGFSLSGIGATGLIRPERAGISLPGARLLLSAAGCATALTAAGVAAATRPTAGLPPRELLAWSASCVVGAFLVWAAIGKMAALPTFARRLRRLPLARRLSRSPVSARRLARASAPPSWC
jgi:hypothetical protein